MDSQRLILLLVFSFSLVMLWDGWQRYNQPKPAPAVTAGQEAAGVPAPTISPALTAAQPPAPTAVPGGPSTPAGAKSAQITVRTDLIAAEVSSLGGDIVRLELLQHRSTTDEKKNLLLLDSGAGHTYLAQSGLIGEALPNHRTLYSLPQGDVELKPGEDVVQVRLEAPEANGVKVAKVLTFRRGSYVVEIAHEIVNGGGVPLAPHAYFQLQRDGKASDSGVPMVQTFTGPALYTEEGKFQKLEFADIDKGKVKLPSKVNNGWIGIVQHYFVGAWLPAGSDAREFFAQKVGADLYTAGVIVPVAAIAPGERGRIGVPLYAGPQEQSKLEKLAPGLDLVVDYGWLTVIAAPLFWLLEWLYKLVGNWGWAIILLTVIIKLIFFPLSAASYKSMAKMRVVTPKMMKIKEMYGSDRARMNQEMMELYKKEKINPLGGCLPIVVQIPVFIALYWVLLGTVEMRHAPWIGWIHDLSAQDPYYVMPLIMGVTMFIQTKLNPTPPDPIQAKIMLFMPIVFTGMMLFFPAGLVLYWTVNNILSIAQQWQITRMIEGGGKPKSA
jgi:YidC/Oxa1 family membrane protein insertase